MDSCPGSYALILCARQPFTLRIGRLGACHGTARHYIYCGSAFGPGGVAARVRHHQAIATRPHWHIDYLRPVTELVDTWYSYAPLNQEHLWTQLFASQRGASLPFAGFGASDCGCNSHLIAFPYAPSVKDFQHTLSATHPHHRVETFRHPNQVA